MKIVYIIIIILVIISTINFVIKSIEFRNYKQGKDGNENCPSSFELKDGDTVNIITCRGKQGKWVPSSSNKLQDTIYYKNDTIIER